VISEGWRDHHGALRCITCGYGMAKHYEETVEDRSLVSIEAVIHSYFGCPEGATRLPRLDEPALSKVVGMLQ
jgi:hypothetical protein